jgi:phage gp46-like protein
MPDIRVVQTVTDLEGVTLDWLLTPMGQIDDTQQLATAVIVALGTDRRANPDDPLPDLRDDDRRGWWGDLDAEAIWQGWPIGSRLWLLARSKIVDGASRGGSTIAKVETYVREALHPFMNAKIASRITVAAARTGIDRISATAVIYRGPLNVIELRFQGLWTEVAG